MRPNFIMKKRLDTVLIEFGTIADAREAFTMVTEGRVFINGQKAVSPAQMVDTNVKVEIREGRKYVGRGALKIEAAIQKFGIDVSGKICVDVGAATGGFTEVLLKHGAKKVYAIDTARGKLALKLREDPRVVVMERTDVRDLRELPEAADVAVIDISLLPLEEILPSVKRLIKTSTSVVALFKPQYETRDPKLLRHGIVKDDATRKALLKEFVAWAEASDWSIQELKESPIQGMGGNKEYLLYLEPISRGE